MLFTERPGRISALVAGQRRVLAAPTDVVRASEAGLMGLAIDPQFASNRLIYVCLASTLGGAANDVRVARFRVTDGYTGLTERTDIVTGAPVNTTGELGRHSGCRPRFGRTARCGSARATRPWATSRRTCGSLGGKILRITRDGAPAAGTRAAPGTRGSGRSATATCRAWPGAPRTAWASPRSTGPTATTRSTAWTPASSAGIPSARRERLRRARPDDRHGEFPDARRAVVPSGPVTNAFCGATFVSGARWGPGTAHSSSRRSRRSPCGRSSSSRRPAGCRTSASR